MAPRGRHSAKPECFLDMIEKYFPTLPKIELNRRGAPRPGWDAWGNEADAPADDRDGVPGFLAPPPSQSPRKRDVFIPVAQHAFHHDHLALQRRRDCRNLSDEREGSIRTADVMAGAAVAASLALQHGTSLETLRRALLRNPHGVASGPLGTALDLVARNHGAAS